MNRKLLILAMAAALGACTNANFDNNSVDVNNDLSIDNNATAVDNMADNTVTKNDACVTKPGSTVCQ